MKKVYLADIADRDFYAELYVEQIEAYQWEARVNFLPVDGQTLGIKVCLMPRSCRNEADAWTQGDTHLRLLGFKTCNSASCKPPQPNVAKSGRPRP